MKRFADYSFIYLFLYIISGCAVGPRFEPMSNIPEKHSVIYIYRPSRMAGSAIGQHIYANGEYVALLESGTYCAYVCKPQDVSFALKDTGGALIPLALNTPIILLPFMEYQTETVHAITIRTEPGKTYFLYRNLGSFVMPLKLVDEKIGREEIKKCKKAETK